MKTVRDARQALAGRRFRPRRRRMRLMMAGDTPTSAVICLPVQRWWRSQQRGLS